MKLDFLGGLSLDSPISYQLLLYKYCFSSTVCLGDSVLLKLYFNTVSFKDILTTLSIKWLLWELKYDIKVRQIVILYQYAGTNIIYNETQLFPSPLADTYQLYQSIKHATITTFCTWSVSAFFGFVGLFLYSPTIVFVCNILWLCCELWIPKSTI